MDIIILHNKHSKESRDFVAQYGLGCTIIDWYGEDRISAKRVDKYFKHGLPQPSAFPTIVDKETKTFIRKPKKFKELEDKIKAEKL